MPAELATDPMTLQTLDAEATAAALPWSALLDEIAVVCREHREGAVQCPPRLVLPLPEDGSLLVMPALGPGLCITKLVTVHPRNAARGLPTIAGEVVALDAATGQRLLLLDGPTLTARRTAAVSLLALRHLCPRSPQQVLIVGAGAQALAHGLALRALYPLVQLALQSRRAAPAVASLLQAEPIAAERQSARAWDLVIAATTSHEPVLQPGVGEGAVVIGVGAFRHDMVELPPALLRGAQIYVDDPAGARAEAGDLLAAGLINPSAPLASLEDLVQGLQPAEDGRTRVFKSVGCARWDLAAARVATRQLGLRP